MARKPWIIWQNRIMADKSKSADLKHEQCELAAAMWLNKYIPFWPNNLQIAALLSTEREILLGGEARSGKSSCALMKAICNAVRAPGFRATFFRETEHELLAPGGLVHTIKKWAAPYPELVWNEKLRTLYFTQNDSTLEFGFLAGPGDERRYLGYERQLFDFEELTNYKFRFDQGDGIKIWNPYQFLTRSQSKPPDMDIDVQVFSTTNPGGLSERFVVNYFMPKEPRGFRKQITGSKVYMIWQPPNDLTLFGGRLYLHGVWLENPGIDHKTYAQSEALADETTRLQQFGGIYGVTAAGGIFKTAVLRENTVRFTPLRVIRRARSWDKAGTMRSERIDGPRSAGVLLSKLAPGEARRLYGDTYHRGIYVIEHVVAGRWSSDQREDNIDAIAMGGDVILDDGTVMAWSGDGKKVRIYHEQEPGSGGKQQAEQTTRRLAARGYIIEHERVTGEKESRAHQLASAINSGIVLIVDDGTGWYEEVIDELKRFPNGVIDIVDAMSLGFNRLADVKPSEAPTAGGQRPAAYGYIAP